MEKLNDCCVLTLSYFPYLFTDLIPLQEDKYYIGWFYNGIIGMLLASNLFVIVMTALQNVKEMISSLIKKSALKKAADAQNAKRKMQEEMMRKLQSNTVDGVSVTIVKRRATELENGLFVDRKMRIEQFKAFKRLERDYRQKAEKAR